MQAGVNQPGRLEKVTLKLPPGVSYTPRGDASLDEMLKKGELDAILSAHAPDFYVAGEPWIVRMFEDYRPIEEAYYRKTGIYPIMHVLAMRREVYDRFPWVAMNLLEAFEEAKERAVTRALEITASRLPIPWIADIAAQSVKLFGDTDALWHRQEPHHPRSLFEIRLRAGRLPPPPRARRFIPRTGFVPGQGVNRRWIGRSISPPFQWSAPAGIDVDTFCKLEGRRYSASILWIGKPYISPDTFCTAAPEAPLPRLSRRATRSACRCVSLAKT